MTAAGAFRTGVRAVSQAACAAGSGQAGAPLPIGRRAPPRLSVVPGARPVTRPLSPTSIRRDADAFGKRAGAQEEGERLEVAAGAGGEAPGVVDRELDARVGRRPGGLEARLVGVGDLLAEAGLAAEGEGRDEAGEVFAVGGEDARAEEAGDRPLGARGELGEEGGLAGAGGGGDLAVRPGPARRRGRGARRRRWPAGRCAGWGGARGAAARG